MLKVLKCLHEQRLQVNIDKCKFLTKQIKYLDMIVTTKGIEIDKKKTEIIHQWKAPISVKKIQAFLGFANFYRQFIFDFFKLSQPLVNATKKTHYMTKAGNKRINFNLYE